MLSLPLRGGRFGRPKHHTMRTLPKMDPHLLPPSTDHHNTSHTKRRLDMPRMRTTLHIKALPTSTVHHQIHTLNSQSNGHPQTTRGQPRNYKIPGNTNNTDPSNIPSQHTAQRTPGGDTAKPNQEKIHNNPPTISPGRKNRHLQPRHTPNLTYTYRH